MAWFAKLVFQRVMLGLLILFLVSLFITFIVDLLPGDTCQALMGQSATPQTVKVCRVELGLNRPAYLRYLDWVGGLLTGHMGRSLANHRPIASLLRARAANTFFLAGMAGLFCIPVAVLLGILTALYRNTLLDRGVNVVALGFMSFPEFFVAYILIYLFAVKLGWFPSMSSVSAPHLGFWERVYRTILPAISLSLAVVGHVMRITRASIVNVLASPYIESAELKGLRGRRIIVHHALPNALSAIINVAAVDLAWLIVGVVVVETVFVYPGLGQLMVESVAKRDLPVVQAVTMIFAAVFVSLNLIADVLSTATNPRLMHPR